jgi:two-component system, LytTR family, sensor kinase
MATGLAFVLGGIIAASLFAGWRLVSAPARVVSPESDAMRSAVHAATATLPYLRTGLTRESAQRAIGHLHALSQAPAVAIVGDADILAAAGTDYLRAGDPLPGWLVNARGNRLHVEQRLRNRVPELGFGSAVVAPLVVRDQRVGGLVGLYKCNERLRPEDTRVVAETASLVAAQLELAELEAQDERLARAELLALRAQISPHFIYNALAAIAALVRTRPDEARELIAEFAAFIRYAFRGERPYVTLADELHYVEKYLRLEQARFGSRLEVRVSVAPEVLAAVVPALSVQPLVENAVRHAVEAQQGPCRVEITGADYDTDVELCVRDDGPGMDAEVARRALAGRGNGIGLGNVHMRLRSTFGPGYGLQLESREDIGTAVRMTVPKFRAGVRAG